MMRTSTSRHVLVAPAGLLLAATAIACQGSVPNNARDIPSAPTVTPYFAQYGVSTHAYRPRQLNPSVDGSLYVTRMRWNMWNDRRAVGTGIAHVNDCKPDCADGHYSTYRVTAYLSHPRDLCGSQFFMTFRLKGSDYRTFAHWAGVGCGHH